MANLKKLYAEADSGTTGIMWSLDDKKKVDKGKLKRIDFPKNSGSTPVSIEFTDNTGRGIRYKTNDPIWVQEGGTCPPASGINSTEIPSTSIVCTGSQLDFTNLNSKDVELVYQLNFVDADGNDVSPQLDPDFKNGGSGPPSGGGSPSLAPAESIFGAAIGALAGVLVAGTATTADILYGAIIGALIGYLAGLFINRRRS